MSTAMDPQWIIDDSTHVDAPAVGGTGHGYAPRDVLEFPCYGASPAEITDIPSMDDWPAICEETEAKQSNLFHIRNRCGPNGGPMPYLVQGRYGWCWAHSATHALMLQLFGCQHQPYQALSAFSIAALIKNGANQGGWAALAFDKMMEVGCGPQSVPGWKQPADPFGPRPDASPKLWTPENRIIASKFKVAEGWWDAGVHPGLRKLSLGMCFKLLMVDFCPTPFEWNWWGHSVLGLRFVDRKDRADKKDPYRYALDFLNSHSNYGQNGVGRVVDSRVKPDSAVSLTSGAAA